MYLIKEDKVVFSSLVIVFQPVILFNLHSITSVNFIQVGKT